MKIYKPLCAVILGSCFLLLVSVSNSRAQGVWIWVNGPDTLEGTGSYGNQGVAAASNCPPAFYQAAQWIDKQGNLWIFGGEGPNENWPADLWKYDPLANMWTWVNGPGTISPAPVYGTMGVPAPNNNPGGRGLGYPTWVDTSGDFWLFGGFGTNSSSHLSDLWRYNIASNEWTWMGGLEDGIEKGVFGNLYELSDTAIPPTRTEENTAWADTNNNLWMFGGIRTLGGVCNDLWRYNVASNQWAWMGGEQQAFSTGSYGTLDVESASNLPPARYSYIHWADSCFLYLSCGPGEGGYLNDVWRFNMNDNEWTWVGGDSGNATVGKYSAYCSCSSDNVPVGRKEERSAQLNGSSQPVLFFFGGTDTVGVLNDLWIFNPLISQFTWLSGAIMANSIGNYGHIGVASPNNIPPATMGCCFWGDNSGHLWLWGGTNNNGNFNAMWEFVPDTSCINTSRLSSRLIYQLSQTSLCFGDTAQISFAGGSTISITPDNYVIWADSLHASLIPDSTTVFTINGFAPCGNIATQTFTLPVNSDSVHITTSAATICSGDSAQICATSAHASYIWNTGLSTSCIYVTNPGNYYVTVSDNNNCSAESNHIGITVYSTPSVSITVAHDTLEVYNASAIQWYLNGNAISHASDSVYVATEPGSYTVQLTDSNGCQAYSNPTVISGINSIDAGGVSIYPNPSQNYWEMNVPGTLLGAEIEIFDATGRVVYKSQVASRVSQIALPNAASGIYELRITGQTFSVVGKLVKL